MAEMVLYCRRSGRDQTYTLTRTQTGWHHHTMGLAAGDCKPTGAPHLFNNLDHDCINYPADLGGYLEYLWREAGDRNMSAVEIQEHLDSLAGWVSDVERSTPTGFFSSYN